MPGLNIAFQTGIVPGTLPTTDSDRCFRWHIGSVNRPAASRLIDWLRDHRAADEIVLVTSGDLPLEVKLPRPDMVGVDRLLDGFAANRLRSPGRPAVVVDVGSAITVDLVDAAGAFLGGAILPGIAMSARALHEFTDLLPQIDMAELAEPPPALGTVTVAAMRSGLFWGAVGAVRQLVEQLTGGSATPRSSSPAARARLSRNSWARLPATCRISLWPALPWRPPR